MTTLPLNEQKEELTALNSYSKVTDSSFCFCGTCCFLNKKTAGNNYRLFLNVFTQVIAESSFLTGEHYSAHQ